MSIGIFLYMYASAAKSPTLVFVLSLMRATGFALVRSSLRDAKYIPKFDYRKESFNSEQLQSSNCNNGKQSAGNG